MDSQQPKGQDSAFSSLNKAINDLNLERDAVGVPSIKAAFDSAAVLLTIIRGSVIDKADYVELGLAYARICRTLDRRVKRSQTNQLSHPVRNAVEQLTTTAIEIHENIVKQGKRNAISRVLHWHSKREKKMFNAWWSGLTKILDVFDTELESNAPATTSNTPRDIANTNAHPDDSDTTTTNSGITPNVLNPSTVYEVSINTANTSTSIHNAPGNTNRGDASRGIREQSEVSNAVNSLGDLSAAKRVEVGGGLSQVNAKDADAAGSTQIPANPTDSTKGESKRQGMNVPMGFRASATMDNAEGPSLPEDPSVRGDTSYGNKGGRDKAANNGGIGIGEIGDRIAEHRGLVDRLTRERTIRTAMGGRPPTPREEEMYKLTKDYLTFLEQFANPTTDFDRFQLEKGLEEFAMLLDHDSDDEQLDKAIAESLAMSTIADEVEEDLPEEVVLRQDNRPVVIRTPDPKCAHVGQLWQALYHVPQVRNRISQYQGPSLPEGVAEVDAPPSGTEGQVLSVRELFEYMESSGLGVLTGEPSMQNFPNHPWEGISPREDVESAYKDLSERVEICLDGGVATRRPDWLRLFHSRINGVTSHERVVFDARNDFSFISVEYNDEDDSSDLVGCLTNQVFSKLPKQRSPSADRATTSEDRAAIEAADVIAFSLARGETPPPGGDTTTRISQERRKFSFPESFHLDRFAATNAGLILDANVAEDLQHGTTAEGSATGAKNDVTAGTKVTASPTAQLSQLAKYDLGAVLMHDGRKGRTHVYSYVSHDSAWWKIVDYTVTQVTLDEVLNDKVGMHLGAGPFFLIYSRSLAMPLTGGSSETSKTTLGPSLASSDSESLYAD